MKKISIVLISLLSINIIYSMDQNDQMNQIDQADATLYKRVYFPTQTLRTGIIYDGNKEFNSIEDKLNSNLIYQQIVQKGYYLQSLNITEKLDQAGNNLMGFVFNIFGNVIPNDQGNRFDANIIAQIKNDGNLEKAKEAALQVSHNFKSIGIAPTKITLLDSDGQIIEEPIIFK